MAPKPEIVLLVCPVTFCNVLFLTEGPSSLGEYWASVPNLPLRLHVYSADPKKLKRLTNNPFLRNTIDVWYKAHQHIGDTPSISRFSPIWGNTYFKAGRADGGFKIWAENGAHFSTSLYSIQLWCHMIKSPPPRG